MTLLLFIALQPNNPSYDEPGIPTAEQECINGLAGNPDGSWCVFTNPANGKKYLVTSGDHR